MSRRLAGTAKLIAALLFVAIGSTADAGFHLWKIDEVFSNASGTVQYIEMFDGSTGEQFTNGQAFHATAGGNSLTLDHNLAGHSTANQHFLIGTAAYAASPGAVAPDFIIPANFFAIAGDTLNYAGFDSVTIPAGTLPTNGSQALFRTFPSTTFAVGQNSPTNFAGQIGTLSPASHPWQNSTNPLDVDNSTHIEPADALLVIDELNIVGPHALTAGLSTPPPPFFDVNGDDAVGASDALQVIDRLNIGPAAAPLAVVGLSVPEPSGSLLALIGAGTIGFMLRRRRRQPRTN